MTTITLILRELEEAESVLACVEAESNKAAKRAKDTSTIKEDAEIAPMTILVDLQDGYFKVINFDTEEMVEHLEITSPNLVQFMEHLFKYELANGTKTGLKEVDFVLEDMPPTDSEIAAMEAELEAGLDEKEAAAEEGAPGEAHAMETDTQEPRKIQVPTNVYMQCSMVEIITQEDGAEEGKFSIVMKELRKLASVGKDNKAELIKLNSTKKNAINGGTMMVRAVVPTVHKTDHLSWLHAIPYTICSPDNLQPGGGVSTLSDSVRSNRLWCRTRRNDLDQHPRREKHLQEREQPPLGLSRLVHSPSANQVQVNDQARKYQWKTTKIHLTERLLTQYYCNKAYYITKAGQTTRTIENEAPIPPLFDWLQQSSMSLKCFE